MSREHIFFFLIIIPIFIFSNTRGIYINRYKASSDDFYKIVNKAIEKDFNAVVIDIKYDRGEVAVHVKDSTYFIKEAFFPIDSLIEKIEYLKEHNIKPIARIVCFKDNILGKYKNYKYAVKYMNGNIFYDSGNAMWVSPYSQFIQNYLINIAKRAIEIGFEEIQFDYIRFPCDFPEGIEPQVLYYTENNGLNGFIVIENFLKKAYKELKPYGVDISADVYGYTIWYDSLIVVKQDIERIAKYTDIIYPMVYPSHFGKNFLMNDSYEQRTYDIIFQSGEKGTNRVNKYNTKIILFLQDFDWKKSQMGKDYINNQIKACENSNAEGFILWNPSSNYNYFKIE